MSRFLVAMLIFSALSACHPDVRVEVEGVTGRDLEEAYSRCIRDDIYDRENDGRRQFEMRLACTQAVYGGRS